MGPCDVCGSADATGVYSSCLGPISFGFCDDCVKDNREPEFMFTVTLELVGTDVASHVKACKTVVDGKVLTWDEWLKARSV